MDLDCFFLYNVGICYHPRIRELKYTPCIYDKPCIYRTVAEGLPRSLRRQLLWAIRDEIFNIDMIELIIQTISQRLEWFDAMECNKCANSILLQKGDVSSLFYDFLRRYNIPIKSCIMTPHGKLINLHGICDYFVEKASDKVCEDIAKALAEREINPNLQIALKTRDGQFHIFL